MSYHHGLDHHHQINFPVFTSKPFSLSNLDKTSQSFQGYHQIPTFPAQARDFKGSESRDYIAESYPEMLKLAENGSFVLVQKRRYGPVSYWIRTEFVEPEEIELVGTGNYPCFSRADGGRAPSAELGIMYVYASADDELGKQLRSNLPSLSGTGFFGAVGRSINLGRCAACKNQRRKCPSDCIFSPYFPPNDPQRYACVHRIFGGSNVGKMLQQIPPYARAQAADSLYVEAQTRIRDPIYGCFGIISQLVQQIHYAECELAKVQAHINILRSQIPQVGDESNFNVLF